MLTLSSASWWRAASIRALRTALLVAIPYVPASYLGGVPYVAMASTAALGFILSLLTSLAGLAETTGTLLPWWYAILGRVVKTVAQALVAGIGTAVLIQDVDWTLLLQTSLTAGFGSLLLAFLVQLPEADLPLAVSTVSNITVNNGVAHEEVIPVVAVVALPADSPPVADGSVRM